ncbi:hypothetical protein BU14_0749s0004 [Porphyra umbilicalis]|uniref:Uncharacterized protein n=1 Tax=Porphyra umbilicalis TaxID=2786 RepID=A0A1X6NP59_PORUM|nr:hypothetical protein BU14_0749s0004 [Porphyra umbilicalis]|eukprot:OSX70449.1 hypothetical protein BU14_0749s0004 [Porphyra umbilicalis]
MGGSRRRGAATAGHGHRRRRGDPPPPPRAEAPRSGRPTAPRSCQISAADQSQGCAGDTGDGGTAGGPVAPRGGAAAAPPPAGAAVPPAAPPGTRRDTVAAARAAGRWGRRRGGAAAPAGPALPAAPPSSAVRGERRGGRGRRGGRRGAGRVDPVAGGAAAGRATVDGRCLARRGGVRRRSAGASVAQSFRVANGRGTVGRAEGTVDRLARGCLQWLAAVGARGGQAAGLTASWATARPRAPLSGWGAAAAGDVHLARTQQKDLWGGFGLWASWAGSVVPPQRAPPSRLSPWSYSAGNGAPA